MAVDQDAALDEETRQAKVSEAVLEVVHRSFRPEFLNRIDELVVFRRLGKAELAAIVDIQLDRLRARLERRELTLEVSEAAKMRLGELGWDPNFGARPLKRAIQKNLEDPISMKLLGAELSSGDRIRVDVRDGALVFDRIAAARSTESSAADAVSKPN